MPFGDLGSLILKQNVLQMPDATIQASRTSPTQAGFPAENAMGYYPSRPAKFDTAALATKRITFVLPTAISCDFVAVIEPHANVGDAVPSSYPVERGIQFRLLRGSVDPGTEVFTWTGLTPSDVDRWGASQWRTFSTVADTHWTVDLRLATGTIGAASVGCVLLGKSLTIPTTVIPLARQVTFGAHVIGRERGPAQFFVRDRSARRYGFRFYHADEDQRVALEQLLAARARPRVDGTGVRGIETVLQRLDLPTVLAPADQYPNPADVFGGAVFGRFLDPPRFETYVGSQAHTDLIFQEMI